MSWLHCRKRVVFRSLAISLLFVFGRGHCPSKYISDVKDEITKFIFDGRKPKIKYDILIGDCLQGGVRFPDLESMMKANRVGWAIKIISTIKCAY